MRLTATSLTQPAPGGDANEDALLVDEPQRIFAVADGLGGLEHGDLASRAAIESLKETAAGEAARPAGGDMPARLRAAFHAANRTVLAHAAERGAKMGTTMTALGFDGGLAYLAHCGDSRAYALPASPPAVTPAIEQLTEDHTLVGDLVRRGAYEKGEAEDHPRRNLLTGFLGRHENLRLQTSCRPVEAGDRLVLCTDGVSNTLKEAEIGRLARLDEPCRRLVEAAREAGGKDDLTVIVIVVGEDGAG